MSLPVGSIPEKINYYFFYKKNITIGANWSFADKKQINVFPTYPADPTDYSSIVAAKRVAQYRNYISKNSSINSITIDNNVINKLQIVSADRNFGGSLTFKVLIDEYLFDIKEEVLLDTIVEKGIDPGGFLKGDFIWAKLGNQIKLIRIGSALHKAIVEYNSKKNLPTIKKKDLQVGGIYQTSKKDLAIYLGLVNTVSFTATKKQFNFKHKPFKKVMVFYSLFLGENPKDAIQFSVLEKDTYRLSIKTSHKFIEKIDKITLSKDILVKIREFFLKKAKNNIIEYSSKSRRNNAGFSIMNENYLEYCITGYSKFINMYPIHETPVKEFDINKYLMLA